MVWQVKALELTPRQMRALGICRVHSTSREVTVDLDRFHGAWPGFAESRWQPANGGRLKAWAGVPGGAASPSGARYVGPENRLYRVEIHSGGEAGGATFKWSRENGSVVFPILSISGKQVTLRRMDGDDPLDLEVGDWVQIVDDDLVLAQGFIQCERHRARLRCAVEEIDGEIAGGDGWRDGELRPITRFKRGRHREACGEGCCASSKPRQTVAPTRAAR